LLGGLRGRYKVEFHSKYVGAALESAGFIKQDTWTGRVYTFTTYPPVMTNWRQVDKFLKELKNE